MKRGEIRWANLPPAAGSGPGFRRPVLVVQSDAFNESRISTVLIAVVTSDLALPNAPGNVRLRKSDSGLRKESVVNVSQVVTLDRRFLGKRVGPLASGAMKRVDEGLRLVLGI